MPHYKCYSCMKTFGSSRVFHRIEEGGSCPYCDVMISESNLLASGVRIPFNTRTFDITPRPVTPAIPGSGRRAAFALLAVQDKEQPRLDIKVEEGDVVMGKRQYRITMSRAPGELTFQAGSWCMLNVAPGDSGAELSIDEAACFRFVRVDVRRDHTLLELDNESPASWSHQLTRPALTPKPTAVSLLLSLHDHRKRLVQREIVRLDGSRWLMAHHLTPVCEVLVMQRLERDIGPPPIPGTAPAIPAAIKLVGSPVHAAYHDALGRVLPSGVRLSVIQVEAKDLWLRDMFLAGNLVGPALDNPSGPAVIEIPSQRGTEGEGDVKRAVATHIAAKYTYESSLPAQKGGDTASGGNFLCTPPTDHCRHGCILVGTDRFTPPTEIAALPYNELLGTEIVAFLGNHHVQPVMAIDTSWLRVGHVDELVTFIPWEKTKFGFKAAVLSHSLAMAILKESGKAPILEGVDNETLKASFRYFQAGGRRADEVSRASWLHAVAPRVEEKMDELKKHLTQLGINPEDIIDLPVLCKMDERKDSAAGLFPMIPFKEGCKFVTPNVINMLVVTRPERSVLCIPKPYGPKTADGCAFELHIRRKLEGSGCIIEFIDDFKACHVDAGNIHCSTLELRQL